VTVKDRYVTSRNEKRTTPDVLVEADGTGAGRR
jgi:hypothetical protein